MKSKFALGLDFGTESVRAVLVDVVSGEVASTAVERYPDGVIDEILPNSSVTLSPEWALQNSREWLTTLEATVKAVVAESGIPLQDVIGIGINFTSCTILPTTADGIPLHTLEEYRDHHHAWVKLWKHHTAQPQALQMLEEDPEIYAAADQIIEGADWVVWQLTGELARNACAALLLNGPSVWDSA